MEHTPRDVRSERLERAAFFILLGLCLVAVWRLPVFLTQDGPSHLYNARILLELWGEDAAGYGRFFTLNTTFSPNWTGNLLLAALLKCFPAVVAEKVLVSGYAILLAFGFRRAARELGGGTPWASSLVFVFVLNFHLLYGFFNFCLGLAVLFWAIPLIHRVGLAPSWKRAVMGGGLLLVLAITHPVPFVVAVLWAVIVGLQAVRSAWATGAGSGATRAAAVFAVLVLPACLLFLVVLPPGADHQALFVDKLNTTALKDLLRMEHLLVFPEPERAPYRLLQLGLVFLLVLAVVPLWKSRGAMRGGLLVLLAVCVLVHFFVSDELAGGAYLTSRMALVAWMVLALWLASSKLHDRLRMPVVIGAGVLAVLHGAVRHVHHAECATAAAEHIAQLAAIPEGAVVLPLCYSPKGEAESRTLSPRIGLFKHMTGYAAADQRFISLDNYEANTAYFQTKWHPEVNPFTQLCSSGDCDIEGQPHTADVDGYEKRSGQAVDVVVLWGAVGRLPINGASPEVLVGRADTFTTQVIDRPH